MSNSPPSNDNTFIRIDDGVVQSSTLTDAGGKRPNFSEVGQYRFFVDAVEADGEICMWSGPEYSEAILAAHELGVDFGAPVHDCVIGGAS